jgi:hexosaminidase
LRFELASDSAKSEMIDQVLSLKQQTFDDWLKFNEALGGGKVKNCNPLGDQSGGVVEKLILRVSDASDELSAGVDETYELKVNGRGEATLDAKTVYGMLRGLMTWQQAVQAVCGWRVLVSVPFTISDAPRFIHRGLLLDTSRHFFPVDKILGTLDAMETAKMNVFHWHITDCDYFPIESRTFPLLSGKGAENAKKVYRVEDVQRIVAYAKLRGIRVIPEFDMPGHTGAWGHGHPEIILDMVSVFCLLLFQCA